MNDDLTAALRNVQRRITETQMRTSARILGIENLYRKAKNTADAEADLYDDLDAHVLLRLQQWAIQGMLADAGSPSEEDLNLVRAKMAEIERLRSDLDERRTPQTISELRFRRPNRLMQNLDDTLATLLKSRSLAEKL